jgi:hypothetical protein
VHSHWSILRAVAAPQPLIIRFNTRSVKSQRVIRVVNEAFMHGGPAPSVVAKQGSTLIWRFATRPLPKLWLCSYVRWSHPVAMRSSPALIAGTGSVIGCGWSAPWGPYPIGCRHARTSRRH